MFTAQDIFAVPVDGIDCLVGVQRSGEALVAIVAVVDGQNSETLIDQLVLDAGVARRKHLTEGSPFYFQSAADPLSYVLDGELRLVGRDDVWTVPLNEWDVSSIAVTADLRYALANCAGANFTRIELSGGDAREVEAGEESFGLDLSPDGQLVAVAANEPAASVVVYDIESFERIHDFAPGLFTYGQRFTSDGAWLVLAHAEGVSRVSVANGDVHGVRTTPGAVLSASVDPSDRFVALTEPLSAGYGENELVVVELATGREVARMGLRDLRALGALRKDQRRRLAEALGEDDVDLDYETEAGVGVSSVSWTAEGLIVTSFGGEVWILR